MNPHINETKVELPRSHGQGRDSFPLGRDSFPCWSRFPAALQALFGHGFFPFPIQAPFQI